MTPYYEDDHVTIYHGDGAELMGCIASGSVAAMLLDPPYSMTPNAVRGRDDGAAGHNGAPVRLLHSLFLETRRCLRPGGVAPTIHDWRRGPDVVYLATTTGLRVATTVAWIRSRVGTGGLFRSAWDPITVFSNGTPDAIDRAAIPNVVHADPPASRVHPYEKPPEIWAHILRRIPTGMVVDPCCGSGASALAARSTGHKWIGVDVDEASCEIAAQRCAQEVLPW